MSPAGPIPPGSERPVSERPETSQAAGLIIARLTAREQTVAAAESLTGGLVAAALTAVPGASAAFRGAVVAYATALKATLLGVSPDLLDALGAVSPEVAAAMAEGVRGRLGATWGLATTGVAGPDAAEGKPVGTVHIAVSDAGATTVRSLALAGSRDEIRQRTVEEVLGLLLGRIRGVLGELGKSAADYSVTSAANTTPCGLPYCRLGRVPWSRQHPLREGSATMVLLRHLLGDVLRRLRLRQGRTLREVSAAARVSLGYLSEVERGQKEASSELLAAICTALGTPLSHVLGEVSDSFALAELQNEPVLAGVAGQPELRVPAGHTRGMDSDPVLRPVALDSDHPAFDEVARRVRDATDMVPV